MGFKRASTEEGFKKKYCSTCIKPLSGFGRYMRGECGPFAHGRPTIFQDEMPPMKIKYYFCFGYEKR